MIETSAAGAVLPEELKRESFAVSGVSVTIESLKDLNATIDRLFSAIDAGEDPRLLEDLCPYFGVVWPSALAASEQLARLGGALRGARVLEVGCGLALPSLVAAKLGATVTATDFHPEVPRFLSRNLELNGLTASQVEYLPLNWLQLGEAPALGPFDWVVGSDILYEKQHPRAAADALTAFAGKKGRIIVTDPLRPYLQSFVDEMTRRGYRHDALPQSVAGADGVAKDVLTLLFF